MDNDDKILKNLFKKASLSKAEAINLHGTGEKDCLPEEVFAAYLENLLDDTDKEKIEEHLSNCKACRQNSIMLNRVRMEVEKEPSLKASHEVTGKAKRLVPDVPAKDLIEVVLGFAKDSIRILKDTATMIKPLEVAPAGTREVSTKEEEKNIVCLSKEFNGIKADIFIEKIDNTYCEIEVKTADTSSGAPLDNIRLNLLSEGKELASYLTIKGRASFKNLPFGTYILAIKKGTNFLGEILLRLESAQ